MKSLLVILLVLVCSTLFAQKRSNGYMIYRYSAISQPYSAVLNYLRDTLFILDENIKFIKIPTGEVYKIVRETKLEKIPKSDFVKPYQLTQSYSDSTRIIIEPNRNYLHK